MDKTLEMICKEYRAAAHELWCAHRTYLKAMYGDDLYTFGYMSFDPNENVVLGISHVWDSDSPEHELEEARFNTMNDFFFKGHDDARADHIARII